MSKFYYCYSYNQKNYLMKNGEYVVVKGIHPETNKNIGCLSAITNVHTGKLSNGTKLTWHKYEDSNMC